MAKPTDNVLLPELPSSVTQTQRMLAAIGRNSTWAEQFTSRRPKIALDVGQQLLRRFDQVGASDAWAARIAQRFRLSEHAPFSTPLLYAAAPPIRRAPGITPLGIATQPPMSLDAPETFAEELKSRGWSLQRHTDAPARPEQFGAQAATAGAPAAAHQRLTSTPAPRVEPALVRRSTVPQSEQAAAPTREVTPAAPAQTADAATLQRYDAPPAQPDATPSLPHTAAPLISPTSESVTKLADQTYAEPINDQTYSATTSLPLLTQRQLSPVHRNAPDLLARMGYTPATSLARPMAFRTPASLGSTQNLPPPADRAQANQPTTTPSAVDQMASGPAQRVVDSLFGQQRLTQRAPTMPAAEQAAGGSAESPPSVEQPVQRNETTHLLPGVFTAAIFQRYSQPWPATPPPALSLRRWPALSVPSLPSRSGALPGDQPLSTPPAAVSPATGVMGQAIPRAAQSGVASHTDLPRAYPALPPAPDVARNDQAFQPLGQPGILRLPAAADATQPIPSAWPDAIDRLRSPTTEAAQPMPATRAGDWSTLPLVGDVLRRTAQPATPLSGQLGRRSGAFFAGSGPGWPSSIAVLQPLPIGGDQQVGSVPQPAGMRPFGPDISRATALPHTGAAASEAAAGATLQSPMPWSGAAESMQRAQGLGLPNETDGWPDAAMTRARRETSDLTLLRMPALATQVGHISDPTRLAQRNDNFMSMAPVLQRETAAPSPAPSEPAAPPPGAAPPPATAAAAPPSVEELARKVYEHLRRELRLEQERNGWRSW